MKKIIEMIEAIKVNDYKVSEEIKLQIDTAILDYRHPIIFSERFYCKFCGHEEMVEEYTSDSKFLILLDGNVEYDQDRYTLVIKHRCCENVTKITISSYGVPKMCPSRLFHSVEFRNSNIPKRMYSKRYDLTDWELIK